MEPFMNYQRIGGMLLLAAGVILFLIGMNASDSLADSWSNFFTGHFTDATVLYILGGVVLAVAGLMGVLFAGRRATS